MATIAELLLEAGARKTQRVPGFVTRIGTEFEIHRSGFNRDQVEAASAGLDRLYALFEVPPVPRRRVHDGTSPIRAKPGPWQDQHQELWDLLVPSSHAAATIQGEVIRLSGKIARELDGNGGVNWDAQFREMAEAWLAHVGSGTPLPPFGLAEAAAIVREIKVQSGMSRLCELSVIWVGLNPIPIRLPPPAFSR